MASRVKEYPRIEIGLKTVMVFAEPYFLSAPSIISALPEIAKYDGRQVRSGELKVINNVYPNFQKLRFWGLTEQVSVGHYRITQLGRDFLAGKVSLPLVMYCYGGQFHKFAGPQVFFKDVMGGITEAA